MKSDLDAIMAAHNLDGLLVTGAADHNPPMVYFTGVANILRADLIKLHTAEPVLFYSPNERDEAARSGLRTKNIADYHPELLIREAGGDLVKAAVALYEKMFADIGLTSGRIAVAGQVDAGASLAVFSALREAMPGLELIGELERSALLDAMATKDAAEIERIRRVGQVTVDVVGNVADFLTSQRTQDGILVKSDGEPLTIGEVKRHINLWLAERGVENPQGTIFSIGYDSAVPHSSGIASDLLRLGQTIIFDIFPCEGGGGYYYDFTRTWCLGYAPEEILALHEDVLVVYRQVTGELRLGELCRSYQVRTCELFEARGHPTVRQNPHTQEGYVHGLGHGVGLYVHDRPSFDVPQASPDRLQPGSVFTIEPGLYYPSRAMAVRLEDTYVVSPDGRIEPLVNYPLDLLLPLR